MKAIASAPVVFRISDIQQSCPGVSIDMIRKILKEKRDLKELECMGRGQKATWRKTSKWPSG